MLIRKVVISTGVAFLIITPIVCFSDVFNIIPLPGFDALTKSYWSALIADPEPVAEHFTAYIVYLGPLCAFFICFWYLWIQRVKQQEILPVVARALEVHGWLKKWSEVNQAETSEKSSVISMKARRVFRKLDRLLSLEDRENWRWWYSVYLSIFYSTKAPHIKTFMDTKVEPPVASWPTPDEASAGLDESERRLLQNALDFSESFTDGAKALTGLKLMLHTITGSAFLGAMSLALAVIWTMLVMGYIGSWTRPVLASFAFSVVVGLIAGYLWFQLSRISKTNKPSQPVEEINQPAPPEGGN